MIVTINTFREYYAKIKHEYYNAEERNIIIFVSKVEVDSVCALRILQGFLNAEGLHYSVYPVTNYEEIQSIALREVNGAEDAKNFILINCGGAGGLQQMLHSSEWQECSASCRITVFDSRRPIFHKYNTADDPNDNVLVVVDDQDPFPAAEVPAAYTAYDANEDDEEDEDEDEDESQADAEGRPTRRRRLNPELVAPDGTRLAKTGERKELYDRKCEEREQELEDYYMNSQGYGKPTAILMYEFAHGFNHDNTVWLWCAILGLTDHLMHMRVSNAHYKHWRDQLASFAEIAGTSNREEKIVVDGDVVMKKPQGSSKIKLQDDLWLPMLRQWTIYDAMLSSPYMGTKMETYRDSGVDRLQLLLAKMGIPLNISKKSWAGIAPRHRRAFQAKLAEHASDSNLSVQDMLFQSFILLHGHDLQLTAADAVYAASALLADVDVDHRRFWRVFHSFDAESGSDKLRRGLELAKSLQTRIIMDTGMAIVRNQLEASRNVLFCYLNLAEVDMLNHSLFTHPTPLLRVAMFIQQHVQTKHMVSKPVVVVSPPLPGGSEGQETCMVLGLGVKSKDPHKPMVNQLGKLLALAADKLDNRDNATYAIKYGFDAAAVEILKHDVETFHEELKYAIISMREGFRT